jgi:hypoxanthine phosphoribosyltransferase
MTLPHSTEKDEWVDWSAYHELIEKLALQVHEANWEFDQILCLARGGLRIGDVLSRIFDKPLAILTTSSYRNDAGTTQGTLDIAQSVTMTAARLEGRVLLVDDMVDSGVTLVRVCEHLKLNYTGITELRTGVLWFKAHSCIRPDFFIQKLETNPWIHQPFEIYDSLKPEDLLGRIVR